MINLHNVLFRPSNLYEALFRQKLLGSGSETIVGTDYVPYLYRPSPTFSQTYNRQRPVVVGGSVAWNQLVDVGATSVTVPSGHKYYANINGAKTIGSSSGSAISINDGSADNVIDLTALWGSTVADAIYAMEQSVAGSGVAYFKALFGEDYYAYNSGSLESVQTSGHVIRDANDTVIGNYALDPDLVLRGVPKWENGGLKYDGDRYLPNGTVERRYGIVDLGSLDYTGGSTSESGKYRWYTTVDGIKGAESTEVSGSVICAKYVTVTGLDTYRAKQGISVGSGANSSRIFIYDESLSASTASAVKTAMSGVYLIYELATPTTESADPYTALQMADPNGTEEWVTSGIVPVGQETEYIQKS